MLAPPNEETPVWIEAEADETTLASIPTKGELRLLGTSVDSTLLTAVELDSWPILPPKGDSEMNVGAEFLFSEDVAEMVEAPKLPNRMETLEAMVAVNAGTPILVTLCRPAAEIGDAFKPVKTAVTLSLTMVIDDSEP